MEEEEVLLPELLGMNGTPSEMILLADFFSKLIDGGEGLLVLIEELINLVEELIYVLVNPVAILKLNDDV